MAIGNPVDFKRYRFHIDFSQTTEYLHLLLTAAHSTELMQHNHAIDYCRLRICNKTKIKDYKDYEKLHWDYRASVRDYSHVADPSDGLVKL